LIGRSDGNYIKGKLPNSVKFFNENLNFNLFYDKKVEFFLKLGPRAASCCPRAGPGSPIFEFAGKGWHGPQFFKITGGHGQRAAKCHGFSPLMYV
jgi:hypothetical protein